MSLIAPRSKRGRAESRWLNFCDISRWCNSGNLPRFDRGAISDFLRSREIMAVSATMLNSATAAT